MQQLKFRTRDEYVNWRRQWKQNYAETQIAIRLCKEATRDMNSSEANRQTAGKELNRMRCLARSQMGALEAANLIFSLTKQPVQPKRVKVKPTKEQIENMQLAKGKYVPISPEVEQVLMN